MPGGATVQDIAVARIVAAMELTKVATAPATAKGQETPTAVADRAKRVGETYKIIYKAVIQAGG